MNLTKYLEVSKQVLSLAESTEEKKRASYTAGNEDVLFNFASDAEFVGTNPLQNVLTHLLKQVRGISSFVKNPDITPSETLISRAADLINYSKLLVAVAEEMGRDTGLVGKHASFPRTSEWLTKRGIDPVQAFDYTFGKDDV